MTVASLPVSYKSLAGSLQSVYISTHLHAHFVTTMWDKYYFANIIIIKLLHCWPTLKQS